MNSCPKCNAAQKFKLPGVLGGTEIGFSCGAVWVQSSSRTSYARKGCDYRASKDATFTGVELGAGESKSVWVNPSTGLPEEVHCATFDEIKEAMEKAWKLDPLGGTAGDG